MQSTNGDPSNRTVDDPQLPPPPNGVGMRGPHHRRARSEMAFRFTEELDLGAAGDPGGSFEEIGSEDDLFCTFMDIEKIGCKLEGSGSGSEGGICGDPTPESSGGVEERRNGNAGGVVPVRPKHRHSSSVDGVSLASAGAVKGDGMFGEVMEAKKAMTPDQLAELAAIDPKRAKRFVFACLIFQNFDFLKYMLTN